MIWLKVTQGRTRPQKAVAKKTRLSQRDKCLSRVILPEMHRSQRGTNADSAIITRDKVLSRCDNGNVTDVTVDFHLILKL